MTRIISGFAGSLALKVPKAGTRPTSDRVREAIFSSLDAIDAIHGARVLDLYAGSGALGLEALSRGAATVTLVERGKDAADICRANTRAVLAGVRDRTPGEVRVEHRSVRLFLEGAAGAWDLVFIDPPYDLDEAALAGDLALLAPLLADDAMVMVERSSRSPEPSWPTGIALERRRDYGETTLWWAERPAD
ncbi:MAG TPA: 16S rRNA (guanine(966)-N(2))-methyltransferase RsmD [Candidatus Lumbricidophila sp.]|nr:16S rRNA (guanine(966)-N(2))-methyltransferase RsmD [Candidatus Lumbricidophila sp.]